MAVFLPFGDFVTLHCVSSIPDCVKALTTGADFPQDWPCLTIVHRSSLINIITGNNCFLYITRPTFLVLFSDIVTLYHFLSDFIVHFAKHVTHSVHIDKN